MAGEVRVRKINREDMLELTRRMTPQRTCFTRIGVGYLDEDGMIDDTVNINFLKMSAANKNKHLQIAKMIPFSETNVQLKEYRFPEESMGKGSMWQLLNAALECGLKNDPLMEVLYEQIGEHFRTDDDFAVFIFHGSYDVPVKAGDGERLDESEEVYSFLIGAVCPLGEGYEPKEPEFGFLFPAFTRRSANVWSIDIYNRDPEHRQTGLMRHILGI